MRGDLWAVVLAGGAGRRLSSLTGGVPKQFWRFDGGWSLLDQTLTRLAPLAPPERTVIVVDDSHRRYADAIVRARPSSRLLFQPEDRGTAAGVLFALLPVLDADPEAVVVITPSDHGVRDDRRFRQGVLAARARARASGSAVLFGVEPTGPNDDYGWIAPGPATRVARLRPVQSFVEKPPAERARLLLESGALWNTMVITARAAVLAGLYRRHLPHVARVFDEALEWPAVARPAFLAARYHDLPRSDFSRDVLTPAQGLWVYAWPASMGWSDLGTPERLSRWIGGAGGARPVETAAPTAAA